MEARKLTRRRIFHASPEEVFQAFVSAEALKEWWSPEGYIVIEARADVRVGGQYSLVMRTETGCETVYVRGFYEEIAPRHKLVFTHMFEHRGSDAPFAGCGKARSARASGVTWLILTFYVPVLYTSFGLIVWQLLRRRGGTALTLRWGQDPKGAPLETPSLGTPHHQEDDHKVQSNTHRQGDGDAG